MPDQSPSTHCGSSIDDRPMGWGGSFKSLTRAEAEAKLHGYDLKYGLKVRR